MEISLYSMKPMWENISHCPYFGKVLLRLYINLTFWNRSSTSWEVGGASCIFLQFSLNHLKTCHASSPVFSILNTNNNLFLFQKLHLLHFGSFLLCVTQSSPICPYISWSLCQKIAKILQQRFYSHWVEQNDYFLFLNTLTVSHSRIRAACLFPQ